MPPFRRQNIPTELSKDDPKIVGYLGNLQNAPVIEVGCSIKWGSTVMPKLGVYVAKTGQTLNKVDYPEFWGYAQNDSNYTTTSTTVTLPTDAGFVVRVL